MLAQLATYFSDSGAAWSVQINNNVARTNLEQVIEDLSVVLGCDGVNVFNPSIGGSTRTDLDSALAAVGTAFGAEYDGTPDIYDTIVTGHDSTAITSNRDGSVEERLEDLIAATLASLRQNPLLSFVETWQDEVASPRLDYWGSAVGGTGTVAFSTADAASGYNKVLVNCPAGADTAALYSAQRWPASGAIMDTTHIVKRVSFEWIAKLGTVANVDNATFFMGFAPTQGNTRASDNVIGFVLSADALQTLTDSGAVETLTAVAGAPNLTVWNKYKIEIYLNGATNTVKFYVNETLKNTHTTNIAAHEKYNNFYQKSEAAVATDLSVGPNRTWVEDNAL